VLLLVAVLALPQEAAPAGCRTCKQRGVTDCPNHEDEWREVERAVRCTVAAECAKCGGALVLDCPKCEGGPESAAADARRAELAAWRAERLPVEEALGRAVLRVEAQHVHLAAEIGTLKDGTRKVSGHQFLHALARDAERAAEMVAEHYGIVRETDYKAPMRLWFWQDRDTHLKVMREHMKISGSGDVKMLGRKPSFSVWTADEAFGDRYVVLLTLGVHNLVHMLQSNVWDEIWIGDQGAGWFDGGAAHWYEEKIYARARHYCIDEAASPPNWENGVWRAAIRALLAKREAAIFPELMRKQTGEMTPEEHALSWSVYDWLVAEHPAALTPLLKALKARKPAREALPESAGLGIIEAELAWREWVEKTYPAREKKSRE
jgi:hypothetical protein